jgi:hypothetical protein
MEEIYTCDTASSPAMVQPGIMKVVTLNYNIEFSDCLYGAKHHTKTHQLCTHSIVSKRFIEPEGSLPRSQELSTCPYTEPNQSSKHHYILSLQGPP